jgi:hypothetical protein
MNMQEVNGYLGSVVEFLSEGRNRFKKGDEVAVTMKGLRAHAKEAPSGQGFSDEVMGWRQKIGRLASRGVTGTVVKVLGPGKVRVDMNGETFDVPEMIFKIAE